MFYAAVAAWCALRVPSALTFVVPGAALGGLLHVWRGRPFVGLLVFALVVVVVPALLWPSMVTGTFADLSSSL